MKVKHIIRNAISNHEKIITEDIKKDQNRNTKLWDNIKKLKGESIERKEIILYNLDGSKMKIEEQPKQLEEYWTGLYRARNNNIKEVQNNEKRREYELKYEQIK